MFALLPRVFAWAALLVAYAGLMAVLYVPRVPRLDVFTPLTGHFVGLAVTASAALLIRRRTFTILVAGASVTALLHALPAYFPTSRGLSIVSASANAQAAPSLKVLALNVWSRNRDPARLLSTLWSSDADVLLLSEVTPEMATYLRVLSPLYPHRLTCPPETPCSQLLLSRHPLGRTGWRTASHTHPGLVWAELAEPHPAAGLKVMSTHLFRPTRNWARHVGQLAGLLEVIRGLDGPLVLGGDLNASASSQTLHRLTSATGLASAGFLPTWPAYPVPLPQFGIDHILVRGGLNVSERGVGPYAGSDHMPVWSHITLPAKPGA